MNTKIYTRLVVLLTVVISSCSVMAGSWQVNFDNNKFDTVAGQAPVNAWGAKLTDQGPSGPAALLSDKGRLTYPGTDEAGINIIPLVRGKLEFDFAPDKGQNAHYAAFDSGNILLSAKQGDSRLRVTLNLNDGSKLNLITHEPLAQGNWSRVTLEWNFGKTVDQVVLSINGVVVDRGNKTKATGLKVSSTKNFTWGMFHWGGNPWNGMYDNLRIE